MLRLVTLVAALVALGTAAHGYWMAVRHTRASEATERIVTWGGLAPRRFFTPETMRYRTQMRWGAWLGLALAILWEYLAV